MSRSWKALGVLCAAYLVLFLWYYPPTHAIEDEVGFINLALVWSKGAISVEGAGFDQLGGGFVEVAGRHVSWRNPLRSLVLLPFLSLGGYASMFISGALLHLALVLVTALTARRLGISPLWAILVLAHPTLAIYSRTIMADELGGLLLMVALFLLVSRDRPGLWVGIAIGLAAAARYQIAIALPFVALALLVSPALKNRKREAAACVLGGAAVGAVIMLYNYTTLGHPIGLTRQGYFHATHIPSNAAHYGLCLLLLWPGMLLALLARSPWRWVHCAFCLPFLALLLAYYWHDQRSGLLEDLVLGQRLLQPVLPIWVVAYAHWLSSDVLPRFKASSGLTRLVRTAVCATAIAGLSVLFHRHQRHLDGLVEVRASVERRVPEGSLILGNSTLHKLFEVPRADAPTYRWQRYQAYRKPSEYRPAFAGEETWYLGYLAKVDGGVPPDGFLTGLSEVTPLETDSARLTLYSLRRSPR